MGGSSAVPAGGGHRQQRDGDGGGGGEGQQGGGAPRPAGAGQLELLGGVFDGLGGDPGGGLVAVAGQVSQHGVVAELARRLPTVGELDLQATVGGPREQVRGDLVAGVGGGHDEPVQIRCGRAGRGCDQAQPVSGSDGADGGDR